MLSLISLLATAALGAAIVVYLLAVADPSPILLFAGALAAAGAWNTFLYTARR